MNKKLSLSDVLSLKLDGLVNESETERFTSKTGVMKTMSPEGSSQVVQREDLERALQTIEGFGPLFEKLVKVAATSRKQALIGKLSAVHAERILKISELIQEVTREMTSY